MNAMLLLYTITIFFLGMSAGAGLVVLIDKIIIRKELEADE